MIVEFFDAEGNKVEIDFPEKFEVCHNCEGHGMHLTPGMRDHAYTIEEFNESFDEDEQAEYFKRGGRYDVTCQVCKGQRVVLAIDESKCDASELASYNQYLEEKAQDDYEDRMTFLGESGLR